MNALRKELDSWRGAFFLAFLGVLGGLAVKAADATREHLPGARTREPASRSARLPLTE
jgi:hypothetical protein